MKNKNYKKLNRCFFKENIDFIKKINSNKIDLLYLFGSEARGTAHAESDIDIGVLFNKKIDPKNYIKLEGELIGIFANIYPKKEINAVNLNLASPILRQAVILEGELLYKKDDTKRILFEIKTLQEYEEYSHLANIYNKFLKIRIKNL